MDFLFGPVPIKRCSDSGGHSKPCWQRFHQPQSATRVVNQRRAGAHCDLCFSLMRSTYVLMHWGLILDYRSLACCYLPLSDTPTSTQHIPLYRCCLWKIYWIIFFQIKMNNLLTRFYFSILLSCIIGCMSIVSVSGCYSRLLSQHTVLMSW